MKRNAFKFKLCLYSKLYLMYPVEIPKRVLKLKSYLIVVFKTTSLATSFKACYYLVNSSKQG